MEGLRTILNDLLRIDGTVAALVVGRDGFVIEGSSNDQMDLDAVGAVAASTMGSSEVMGSELGRGQLGSILIEYEFGPIAVSLIGPEALLVVVGDVRSNLGRLRLEMRRVRPMVAEQF